ncbi:MAG: hypothetical protein J7L08_00240, partial [Candidatus Aenigmarchaeota archaeon]|nr:hypothetical protein [Candidatus Aenigmarchaeota archaeon]
MKTEIKFIFGILVVAIIFISGCIQSPPVTSTTSITTSTTTYTTITIIQSTTTTTVTIQKFCNEGGYLETPYGECTVKTNPVFYCDPKTGKLMENCSICGCVREDEICGEDGKCYIPTCEGESYSPDTHECVDNNLMLKYHTKKFGVLYVYWNGETYNPEWNEKIPPLFDKARDALLKLTEGKADYTFDILGSIKTKEFCWNPSRLAWASQEKRWKINPSTGEVIDYQESEYIDETDEYHRGDPTNLMIIPGSDFGNYRTSIDSYEQRVFEEGREYLIKVKTEFYYNDCKNCK